ncbi:MAG: DUF4276 family protein [Candidatus Omnitrophica bacterium]|nr:hypothetical protein [bacterium]NUN95499.1 DUF4276 family protein [Candidatus Omnitrophota bacterium]
MVRLYIFAEGFTEQTFAGVVLKPHLGQFGVQMHKPLLIAHARRRGRVHRGGGGRYGPMRSDIVRLLRQEEGKDVFFTNMVDLYGLHSDFPGKDRAEAFRRDPLRRVEFLEGSWAEDIGDTRFIPFIQLHEYEALLFVDVEILGRFHPKRQRSISDLRRIAESKDSPELIDDGEETAPSKQILSKIPEYQKAVDGPQAAADIGLERIRSKCPHFDAWVHKLESLGSM